MTQAETDNVEMSEKSEPVKITLVSISKSEKFRIRPKQLKFGYFYFNTCFSLKLFDLD